MKYHNKIIIKCKKFAYINAKSYGNFWKYYEILQKYYEILRNIAEIFAKYCENIAKYCEILRNIAKIYEIFLRKPPKVSEICEVKICANFRLLKFPDAVIQFLRFIAH